MQGSTRLRWRFCGTHASYALSASVKWCRARRAGVGVRGRSSGVAPGIPGAGSRCRLDFVCRGVICDHGKLGLRPGLELRRCRGEKLTNHGHGASRYQRQRRHGDADAPQLQNAGAQSTGWNLRDGDGTEPIAIPADQSTLRTMNARTKRCLRKYFQGYRAIMGERRVSGVQGFESFFRRLAEDLPALQESRRQQELVHAPHFNIFRVLPIERRETVLHSPMLAHLLDPTASHGQGYLFLKAFFHQIADADARFLLPAEPLEASEWSVRTEVYIGNGIIDLLIECPTQRYVLAIENKIDAAEQHTQLSRYYRWLQEDRADYATRQLVFLTPTGRDSRMRVPFRYFRMSYRRDILEFLNQTVPKIQPPRLKELVSQYQAILNDWAQEEIDE